MVVFVTQERISDGSYIWKFCIECSKMENRFEVGVDMAGTPTTFTHHSGKLFPTQSTPIAINQPLLRILARMPKRNHGMSLGLIARLEDDIAI